VAQVQAKLEIKPLITAARAVIMTPLPSSPRVKLTISCACLQFCFALTSMMELVLICCSMGIGSGNKQAQWVCALCMPLPVEVVRLCSIFRIVAHEKGAHAGVVISYLVLLVSSIASFILLPICFLVAVRDEYEHTESWKSWMVCMLLLNGFCCFFGTFSLLAEHERNPSDDPEAQVGPPIPRVMPTRPEPAKHKRLALRTLQTFAMEPRSSEMDEAQECAICLMNCPCPGEVVTEFHCHHKFHFSCIAMWKYKGGSGCPMRCEPPPVLNEVDDEAAVQP